MKIRDVNSVPWDVSPTPVEIVGTTFGNELQNKINNRILVNNGLLLYLCIFFSIRLWFYGF